MTVLNDTLSNTNRLIPFPQIVCLDTGDIPEAKKESMSASATSWMEIRFENDYVVDAFALLLLACCVQKFSKMTFNRCARIQINHKSRRRERIPAAREKHSITLRMTCINSLISHSPDKKAFERSDFGRVGKNTGDWVEGLFEPFKTLVVENVMCGRASVCWIFQR